MANGENLGSINYSVDVDYSALIAAGRAQDEFSEKSRQSSRDIKKTGTETNRAAKEVERGSQTMDRSFNMVRRTVQLLGAAIGGLTVGRVVSEFATFEQGARNVAAVSGATAAELEGLSQAALGAAASTRFNPQQTTQALYSLASAGQDVESQMLSLTNVLNLAEAGQADLGRATELTTSTISQFNLTARDSQRVADVFVASIGASALNVNRLQVAMRNAGPTAAALNQTLEGSTAVIGTLTTAFGNGERAGTGFRAILNELPQQAERLGVSVRSANGEFRPFVDILQDIEANGITAGQAVEMFGAEAGPALAALITRGSGALRDMEGRLTSNGQAAETAARQLDTLRGDMDALSSSVSVALIEIGAAESGALRSTTQTVTNLVRLWSGYGDTLGDQRETTQQLATTLQTAAAAAGGMAAVSVAIRGATVAQIAFNAAARANPYVLIATTIAGATAAVWAFVNAQESAVAVWERAQESEAAYQAAMANTGAANRVQEIARERMELERQRQELEEKGFRRYGRDANRHASIVKQLTELEREYHEITDARIEAERARSRRQEAADERERKSKEEQLKLQQQILDAASAQLTAEGVQSIIDALEAERYQLQNGERAWLARRLQLEGATRAQIDNALAIFDASEAIKNQRRETEELTSAVGNLLDSVDPLREFARTWSLVQRGVAAGLIDDSQAQAIMDSLVDAGEEAGEAAADAFSERFIQSAFDNIISGNWQSVGRLIGGQIGTSLVSDLGRYLNKNFGDVFEEVAKDGGGTNLKAALGGLGSVIGTAMASPIAAPIAGAIVAELGSKLFGFDDWDPTAERQASQGTGTVLGSIDAKSESIANAVDVSANASRELVGINREMLRALQAVQLGIQGASSRVAQGQRGVSLPGVSVNENFFDNFGVVGEALTGYWDAIGSIFTLGLFDSLGSSIGKALGGRSRQVDEGVQIIGGYITDLVDETIVNAYATFRVKKNAISRTKTKEQFQRIGGDVEQQFQLVFESLLDSVVAGADALGVDAMGRLAGFRVQTQRLSLEGLSAEQQTAELEAYFGTVFDQLAGAAIPFLDDFQRAGEGLGETLARVATQVQVTEQAVDMLGLRFSTLAGAELIEASDRLIELNGGLDQFISGMQNFIGNFATESQQFAINANALAQGMGDLPLPQTRDGFWALMQAQDAATKEGAENIATLLRLQGVADQYYSAMEKAQTSYYESEIQGQQQRLSEAQRANRAVQSAMDAMLFQSSAVQEASRQSALRTLEQIANAGRVSDISQLQSALDAATQLDQGRYSTFADYAREYARTSGVIGRVGDVTQTAEDREARMLRSLENQLEAVKGLREDLDRTQLAIIKQTNKTAKTLERIELDGIEVREA